MKVTLISNTPDPEKVIAIAAKTCYSSNNITEILNDVSDGNTDIGKYIDMLMDMGHESPIEHVSFTFAIDGVSRSLLAQITRHRIASYSVKSQRYVDESSFEYVTPPAIEQHQEIKGYYDKLMENLSKAYKVIADLLYEGYISNIKDEETRNSLRKSQRKKALEDARFILPNACTTNIVATFNARSLFNFFKLRCCNRAQWEIRELAEEMYKIVYNLAPNLFKYAGPACVVTGKCPEGKMSCHLASDKKLKYEAIRKEAVRVDEVSLDVDLYDLFYDATSNSFFIITEMRDNHCFLAYFDGINIQSHKAAFVDECLQYSTLAVSDLKTMVPTDINNVVLLYKDGVIDRYSISFDKFKQYVAFNNYVKVGKLEPNMSKDSILSLYESMRDLQDSDI